MKNVDRVRFAKIGEKGEAKLRGKTAAIAGLGSMGSTIATMLAREDIGLRLIDMGRVEESDMHRLDIFHEEDITKFKVKQAKARLAAINPAVPIKSFHEEIASSNVFLLEGDVIIDATNSSEINVLVAAHAAKKKVPLIVVRSSGADGCVLVASKALPPAKLKAAALPPVESKGIFGPVTSMIASAAVAETMKLLLGEKINRVVSCNAWDLKMKETKL